MHIHPSPSPKRPLL